MIHAHTHPDCELTRRRNYFSENIEYAAEGVKAPRGFEWAQNTLDAACKAIAAIQEREKATYGKSISVESFCREGVILIADAKFVDRETKKGDGNHIRAAVIALYRKDKPLIPAIMLNHSHLKNAGKDAGFLLGHELAEWNNVPPDKRKQRADDLLKGKVAKDVRYAMHSGNHLFGMALNLDNIQAYLDGRLDFTVSKFTERRLNTKSQAANSVELPKEMLADMNGLLLGTPPTFVEPPKGTRATDFVPHSPLTEEYMRGPYALDLMYRFMKPRLGTPDTPDFRDYQGFQARILSPTGTLPQQDFAYINGFLAEIRGGKTPDPAKLARCQSIIHTAIASFQLELDKMRGELAGRRI